MGAFDHIYLCYMTFIFCEMTLQVLFTFSTSYLRLRHLSHNIIHFLKQGCKISPSLQY
jgi:hypothetical protein